MASADHRLVSIESSFTAFAHGRYILDIETRARKLRKQIRNLNLVSYDPSVDSHHYLDSMDDLRESYMRQLERIFQLVPKSETMDDRECAKRIEEIFVECRTQLVHLNSEKAMAVRNEIIIKYQSVPSFEGNVQDWVEFRSEFQNRVMENPSGDDEKRQVFQLKVSSDLVKNLPSRKSINDLWKELCAKFDHQASNFHAHELCSQPRMSNNMTPEELSNLLQNTENHIQALHQLGYDMNPLSEIILGCLLKKKTPRSFQKDLRNVGYLLTRTRMASVLLNEASSKPLRSRTSNLSCFYCQKSHMMRLCSKFLKLPFERRFELVVKEEKLCHICLSPVHSGENCCTKVKCSVCGGRHNTVLHPGDEDKKKLALLDSLLN